MSGLKEHFAGRIEFIVLDLDNAAHDGARRQLGITAQAQYVLVNASGNIVGRWWGILDEAALSDELEDLLQA